MCVGALVLLALPTATSLRLTTITDVQCAGSGDLCSGDQCCPGYEGSDFLTFPCPTATAGFDQCQTIIRYPYEAESDDTVSAVGDPHVTSITGEKFDLWVTGWSTFLQVPKNVEPNSVPKLLVTGNVQPYHAEKCAPAYLQTVKVTGSLIDHHEVMVRAGSLETSVPFGISLNGSAFIPIGSSGSSSFSSQSFSLHGKISEDEPGVWGPDAKLVIEVGAIMLTVTQHTEGRFDDSRSMLDVSVTGLDGVENVGGWLGVDGALSAGRAPPECLNVAFIAAGTHPRHDDDPEAVGFQSPHIW